MSDLKDFLQWFCASVSWKLGLPERLEGNWSRILGAKVNCTNYFERYILSEITSPLALGLDEVDLVFQHPEIAADFFGLLRAWHEEAKDKDLWKKLRLVVVHSTEVYIPMNINQSPFNVGLSIELPEFQPEAVQELAQRHELRWNRSQVEQLMQMVGGHPFLVRVALYHIARGEMALEQLLQIAPTEAGPYGDHLRRHWWNLKQHPELATAIKQAIPATRSIQLEPMQAFKVAQRLGCGTKSLRRRFPDSCTAISARYLDYRECIRTQKIEASCEDVRQTALKLYDVGIDPARSYIAKCLIKPAYFREPRVLAALKAVRQELGLDLDPFASKNLQP